MELVSHLSHAWYTSPSIKLFDLITIIIIIITIIIGEAYK